MIILFLPIIPISEAKVDCVILQKTSTQEFVCVFPDSVEKLTQRNYGVALEVLPSPLDDPNIAQVYEKGWAMLGESWKYACRDVTMNIEGTQCILRGDNIDICSNTPNEPVCWSVDIKPKTVEGCKDKYEHGYLDLYIRKNPADFRYYSAVKCDLW